MENLWILLLVLIAVVVVGYMMSRGGKSALDSCKPVSLEYFPDDDELTLGHGEESFIEMQQGEVESLPEQ